MALREVLAELDVKVRGSGAVRAANADLDRYTRSLDPAAAKIEDLRIKQAEASEMASRLAQRLRGLQAAEGDNAAEIEQLRRAQFRATDAAKAAGTEIAALEREEREAAAAARKLAEDTAALPGEVARLAEEERKAAGATGASSTATGRLTQRLQAMLDPVNLAVAGLAAIAAAGVAVVAAARAAVAELGELIDEGHELANLAARLNMSSTELQRWRFIAEQTGLETTALTSSFGALARNVEAAAHGGGPAVRDFRRLGVSLRDGNGALRDQGELFRDTILALSRVDDRTRRAAIAQRIFSEGGTQLLALIDEGPEAIDRLSSRFDELGGGLSEDVVAGAEEAHDSMAEFDVLLTSLRSRIARNFLPVVNRLLAWASDWSAGVGRAIERSSAMWLAWGALRAAGAGLEATLSAVGAVVRWLARPLVGLVLVVEDLVTAVRGGRSVVGDGFEAMTGHTMTFRGALERAGLSWARFEASASRAIATVLEGVVAVAALTGMTGVVEALTPTALAWRDRAAADEETAATGDRMAAAVDAGRLFSRKVAADPTIAARNRAAIEAASVTHNTTYTISGVTDPEEVGRIVDERERRRLREAADTLPLALAAGGA